MEPNGIRGDKKESHARRSLPQGSSTSPCCGRTRLILIALLICLALLWSLLSGEGEGSSPIRLTILHTADEHSALIPHSPSLDYRPGRSDPTRGGFARLAGAISAQRQSREEPVLLLSAGDFLGGTMFSWLALEGEAPELSLMVEMEYDAVAIGNHEFDYGPEILAEYLEAAGYPGQERPLLLGANLEIPQEHPLAGAGIRDWALFDLPGGIRVGVFGILGVDAARVVALPGEVGFSDPVASAREAVGDLKGEGADLIIALTHSGLEEDRDLARRVEGIDVIVGGHCHTPLEQPVLEGGTVIVQSGPHLNYLGILELELGPEGLKVLNSQTGSPHLLPLDSEIPEDPGVKARVDEYGEILSQVVARITGGRHSDLLEPVLRLEGTVSRAVRAESPMGNLLADALRAEAEKVWGSPVDFAFQASGQTRAELRPGGDGLISLYDAVLSANLGVSPDGLPGYPLVLVHLTGDEVLRVLEISVLLSQLLGDAFFLDVSGLSFEYDPARAVLIHLPVLDVPVPTYRSVLRARTEEGHTLRRGDQTLYSVVTDLYVANFVPMVGDLLPRLAIQPRDATGERLEVEEAILTRQGREVLVWEALLSYLSDQEPGPGGIPLLDAGYLEPQGRAAVRTTFPLLFWVLLGLGVILGLIAWIVHRLVGRWRKARGRAGARPGSV